MNRGGKLQENMEMKELKGVIAKQFLLAFFLEIVSKIMSFFAGLSLDFSLILFPMPPFLFPLTPTHSPCFAS